MYDWNLFHCKVVRYHAIDFSRHSWIVQTKNGNERFYGISFQIFIFVHLAWISRSWFELFKEGYNSDFSDCLRKINQSWWLEKNHSPEFARLLDKFCMWLDQQGSTNLWLHKLMLLNHHGTRVNFLLTRDLRNVHLNFSMVTFQINLLSCLKIEPASSEINNIWMFWIL